MLARTFAILLGLFGATSLSAEDLKPATPGKEWEQVKPEAAGLSSARLEILRSWLKTHKTTAMMVVIDGRVAFEYGDLARVSKVASVRKSILAMLFGKYEVDGKVDLSRTVKDMGLADVKPFLPIEERATLLHLLTARSGIYHDSGNASLTTLSPRRGAQTPGEFHQYQNWDFNAAGTAFEKLTGRDLYEALETDLAKPLGMQDFDRKRQRKINAMPDSVHPEYAMYLSTRDMTRIGLLMMRGGGWNGAQLLPKGWSTRITALVTRPEDMHPVGIGGTHAAMGGGRWGYGMLWWVWDSPVWPGVVSGPYQGAYTAMGANGQYITVLPVLDAVVVHKVDIDNDESADVSSVEYAAMLDMLIASNCGECK